MKEVKLRMNELEKYNVIKELVDHNGNKNRAATKLNLSRRQIDRLIIKYKEKGKSSFVHGNREHTPSHAIDKTVSNEIILLYKKKYYDFNFKHFKEYLEEKENIKISYKCIYNLLSNDGILSPKARKKTKKEFKKQQLLKEKKLDNKNEEEIEYIVNHEIALEDAHPRQEKPKNFGELIEMDGSIHLWFGDKKACLHLAVDKATNTIPGAYFDYQETLNGYYHLLYQIITNYGIPYKFLTDNRTVFNYMSLNPDKRTTDKDVLTQFGYACKQLGIALETTSVSQAKGLIERDNGTFQDRLVSELRLNNITTIDDANKYLSEVFVPNFNKKFAMDFKKFPSVFESSPSNEKINYTLAVLTPRKIDNGNAIKFKNKYYQPYLNNELKCFLPKTECLVINAFNDDLIVSIDENIYELKELSRNERFSKEFDEVPIVIERKKYIPPMNHPWKCKSFKQHIKKAHTTHVY
ncbi:MAG: ISNCY family transposase, partial [Cetobacterium sp.]|uniref:ISNCY family transposase n=1 Tax=Cetobacterium sp. TaxID=2071632 RepID=UPI002FCAE584